MSMSMSPPAIRCRNLVKRYPGGTLAVDGLDLEVRVGECFGLLGPNGAGKTTTVEILEGLIEPTAGEVEILGGTWARDGERLRQRLGVTLQQTHLPDRMTVAEILTLFRSFFGRGRDVETALDLVSLRDKRDTWYMRLSGGQKQRLAVACALVGVPDLLFLDEPTTGLDPQSRRQLWDLVIGLKADGCTVLLTTHYMDEAERLCDHVAVVDRGKVVALGTPRELIASLGGQEVIEFAVAGEALDPEPLGRLPGVRAARALAGGYALTVSEVHIALPALLAHLDGERRQLERLSTHHATLEDVFVTLTGRQLRD
ncbi:MAG TPA: ABC transporter ATP-binding protein [Polyangia bacterium]|jgi:ABC-2 type transport system ATP-binding protein|nr:ABC transporter ATP-binding protein [Polyangia bacterium]